MKRDGLGSHPIPRLAQGYLVLESFSHENAASRMRWYQPEHCHMLPIDPL
jgi:hypothetical protein